MRQVVASAHWQAERHGSVAAVVRAAGYDCKDEVEEAEGSSVEEHNGGAAALNDAEGGGG